MDIEPAIIDGLTVDVNNDSRLMCDLLAEHTRISRILNAPRARLRVRMVKIERIIAFMKSEAAASD